MAKQLNTDLKFTATPNTSNDYNNDTSTTGIGSSSTTFTSSSYNFTTTCKYYLPCGKCDKTGEICTHYAPIYPSEPYYPHYPGWWEFGPTCWTSSDASNVTNRTEFGNDGNIYTMNMTDTKEVK